jgi:hypothetical protein
MTPPARGDDAAARARATTHGTRPQPAVPPRPAPPMLVRLGGRWLCRHDLAIHSATQEIDVQLRP